MSATHLFTPLKMRDVTLRNRIAVSPMCQYSCDDGFTNDWHLVHLGSRAVGGAGLVMVEATAVEARGRISPSDSGIWKDEHIPSLARIAAFLREQGAVAGIQLAHAGRKASVRRPWEGGGAIPEDSGGWQTVAPSPVPFQPEDPAPTELSKVEIRSMVAAFVAAAERAVQAGFQVAEIHGAPTNTAGVLITASGLHWKWWRRCGERGLGISHSFCGSRLPIGWREAGPRMNR